MKIEPPTTSYQLKDLSTALPQTFSTFKFELENPFETYVFSFLSQLLFICAENR